MAVIKTAPAPKVAHVPATFLKVVAGIRKDAAYILNTITDDHGADSGISARMLRYTLADACAAFGKKDTSAQARALIYLVVAYLNGSNGLDGLTKPLPRWLAQVFRNHFETIRPAQPVASDVLLHVDALLARAEKVGAAPKAEKDDVGDDTDGTVNPTNQNIPTQGTDAARAVSAQFARRESQRAKTAQRVRALRATVAAQSALIAELRAMLAAQKETAAPAKKRARARVAAVV